MNEIITALINYFETKQLEKITSNTYKELLCKNHKHKMCYLINKECLQIGISQPNHRHI